MLNPFPTLLWLGILTPFLLRLVLGGFFFLVGYTHLKRRKSLFEEAFSGQFGSRGKNTLLILGGIELLVSVGLVFGFLTQITALVALMYSVIGIFYKESKVLLGYDTIIYLLTFGIALSLLLSGAGPFAFDVPL